jgi:transcriptional regulator with XRE-family HTH domain
MANQRLRTAIRAAGLTVEDVATGVGVDIKTVERWVSHEDRCPHRATRKNVAQLVSVDEVHLWPSLAEDVHTRPNGQGELVHVYPTRSAVPAELWTELLNGVTTRMDVLVFSGTFLVEQYNLLPTVRAKSREGIAFRFAVGDETSSAVIQRAIEEGTRGGLEGRVQLMRRYLNEIEGLVGVEVRSHGTYLYNSIYRFDDQVLVNTHSYGSLAGQNPVLHLRELPGGLMWENYSRAFERVWDQAMPESVGR